MEKEKVIFAWSGGKDSSLALYKLFQSNKYEILTLFTTVNKNYGRVSMHGIREDLMDEQAKAIGLPIEKIYVSEGTNKEYEAKMETFLTKYKKKGVSKVVFGDIFLDDLREYRDNNLKKVEMHGYYPLWKKNTTLLVKEFIELGFRSITCCIQDTFLTKKHVGKVIDNDFISSLPKSVDPCGENGEFHSFTFEGPIFRTSMNIRCGEIIYKPIKPDKKSNNQLNSTLNTKGFWFCDILPL